LIDATSLDAIRRGDYQLVLGELHVINTLAVSCFMTQCPDADDIARTLALDSPEPRIYWMPPKAAALQRTAYLLTPNDVVYVGSQDASPPPPDRTLTVSDLIVAEEAGTLVVRTRDGRLRVPCLEFFGYLMLRKEVNVISPVDAAAHRPRVTIDSLVIQREQWRLPLAELAFAA